MNSSLKQCELSTLLLLKLVSSRILFLSLLERLEDIQSTNIILGKVECHSISDPVLLNTRLGNQELATGLGITLIVTKLNLKLTEISQNVLIAWVVPQGIQISLTSLVVVFVSTMQDAIDVPASKVGQVLEQSLLDLIESLCLLFLSVQIEGLHSESFGVVRVLLKNLFGILDRLLELFIIIEL